MAIEIRRATAADVGDIGACVRAAYRPFVRAMGREPAPMRVDHRAEIERGVVWVAVDDDRVLGTIAMWPVDDHWYVDNIAVVPRHHGRGIGAALLETAECQARESGVGEIRLYTNVVMEQNLGWYPRRGFAETHRAEQDGYQRVYFRRLLPDV